MHIFRKLAENIFFKILLGFVALTFVLFGVSEFILGSPNSWVAKVGDTKISYNAFNKALQSDKEIIMASAKSEEVIKFLESDQFKSEVLNRMINKIIVKKLHEELGVEASKKLILKSIAQDPNFKNAQGKFDHESFKRFLAKNGLNEERYFEEISSEIIATMIVQTIALNSTINTPSLLELENFKNEKRVADVLTINLSNIKSLPQASENEISDYYKANKDKYFTPEKRSFSYIHFTKNDFAKDFKVSESEILAEYEANKIHYTKPQERSLYHLSFETENEAKSFLQKLNESKADKKSSFSKLAKEIAKKDLKAISLNNISKDGMISELSEQIFKLDLGQVSDVVKSSLGFHVLLLNDIKNYPPTALSQVRKSIEQRIAKNKEETLLQKKISEIDDTILSTNSLEKTAQKFGLKIKKSAKVDDAGKNENGQEIQENKLFADFIKNGFLLKEKQISKIFLAKNSNGFYILQADEISPKAQLDLAKVRNEVIANLAKENRKIALENLAKTVASEIKANPNQVNEIAAKYKIRLEKNKLFPRSFYIEVGDGKKVPYQDDFLTELFKIKLNEATPVSNSGVEEFKIGVLRKIEKSNTSLSEIYANKHLMENFKTEILQEYHAFLLKNNKLEINEKFFGAKQ